jgi:6-phosphogluconolactonase
MAKPQFIVCPDMEALAQAAAERIAQAAACSIAERGLFTIALAGGSTPKRTYAELAAGNVSPSVDWSRTYLFFGDERCVPLDDERSNYRMARESLIEPAHVAADHVFPVPTDSGDARQAAGAYAAVLADFFGLAPGAMPVFDLVLLGLGDDGHTASLFPGARALAVVDTPVTSSPSGVLPPPVDRVTLTFPAINAARQVMFLVAGAGKAEALRDVWQGHVTPVERPAVGVQPTGGQLIWLVDQAAASLCKPKPE